MAGATEFTLESVRQFMLAREGKVTNHELVKQFKTWLTHPTEKDAARKQFKDYVNTLSTIKQENGEKYLVLKRKFYPKFDDELDSSSSPSLLDEVMAGYQSLARVPPSLSSSASSNYGVIPADLGLPIVTGSKRPSTSSSSPSYYSPTHSQRSSYAPTPPLPVAPPPLYRVPSINNAPPYRAPPPPPPSAPVPIPYPKDAPPPPLPKRNAEPDDNYRPLPPHPSEPPPLPTKPPINGESKKKKIDKRLSGSTSSLNSKTPADSDSLSKRSCSVAEINKENTSPVSEKNEKISVKERTKTFNRMASEVELNVIKQQAVSLSGTAVKRRNSRASRPSVKDDDNGSISTLDQYVKRWMIKASQGDYHGAAKMLQEDGRLAKHKDFTNGYTALHWACKHGNLDMVKMLCGNYNVDVNSKTHGGYTPLHLTCQFGNKEVFEVLVKAYGADPNIRDNSGKKPRQYMVITDQASTLSLSSSTFKQLKDRRKHRRQASEKNAGILRFGSLSVKVKKTTEAFNNYFHSGEKKSFDSDRQRMPPPKFAPIKKRKSKRSVDFGKIKSAPVTPTNDHYSVKEIVEEEEEDELDSDSEYGFDSQWSH